MYDILAPNEGHFEIPTKLEVLCSKIHVYINSLATLQNIKECLVFVLPVCMSLRIRSFIWANTGVTSIWDQGMLLIIGLLVVSTLDLMC